MNDFNIRDLEAIAEMTDSIYVFQPGTWTIKGLEFTLIETNERMYIKTDDYDYRYVYNGSRIWEYINHVFK